MSALPRSSPYRWVVLAAFSGVNLTIQLLWISYAPVTGLAATFYQTNDLGIGALSMVFMAAFLPFSIPASWVIDTKGFRFGAGLGAVLMAIFGPLRGLADSNYTLVFLCTAGLAIAQPFFLNAWTKLPALWFPVKERATAVGIITLANLVGTGIGMALTPVLIEHEHWSIPQVQLAYGLAAALSSVLFFAFAREKPATPPGDEREEVRALMFDGLIHALKNPSFLKYLAITFVGMGVFNGVTTWIEGIVRGRGYSPEDAGNLGAAMLVGGLLGAIVIPALSDRQRARRRYIVLGVAMSIPGLLGLTFAPSFSSLVASSAGLGFFLVSTLPVGMQYAAEITQPTPEGTSSGLIQLCGQASVVFVYVMGALKTADGSYSASLVLGAALLFGCALLATRLVEPGHVGKVTTPAPVAPE